MPDLELIEQLDRAIDALLAGDETSSFDDPTLSGLMKIAGALRDLPDDRFKVHLGLELSTASTRNPFQRRTSMITSTPAEAVAIQSVMPFITVPEGNKLIEFMQHTFGAVETSRNPHGTDGFVAVVRIADSDLLVMGDVSLRGQEAPAALHVYVKDCDATYQRALQAGAFAIGSPGVGEPADRPYGERAAFVSDPFGNYWFIATRLVGNYVDEGSRHIIPALLPTNAGPVLNFLERAFGAKVEGLHEEGGRLVHAFIRIGEGMLEISQPEEQRRPSGFYLHTDDVDALYNRAVAAGGISILPPADQQYGDRLAIIQDPAGNRWFAAKRI